MPRLSVDKQTAMHQCVRRHILGYKAERLADGCDIGAISAALGFTISTLRNRINDPKKITIEELGRIANTLNISVSTLLGERS